MGSHFKSSLKFMDIVGENWLSITSLKNYMQYLYGRERISELFVGLYQITHACSLQSFTKILNFHPLEDLSSSYLLELVISIKFVDKEGK